MNKEKLKKMKKINEVIRMDADFFVKENRFTILKNVVRGLKDQNCTDYYLDGDCLHFGNQFYLLPTKSREIKGNLEIRSKDLIFTSEDGEKTYCQLKNVVVKNNVIYVVNTNIYYIIKGDVE